MDGFKEVGLMLSKGIGKKLRINAGVGCANSTVEFSPVSFPNCFADFIFIQNRDFEMLSIPVLAEYVLGKYFYGATGPAVDFQHSEWNIFSDQSGFGYLVELGARFGGEKLSFIVFPNYKRYSLIPFEKQEGAKDILHEF